MNYSKYTLLIILSLLISTLEAQVKKWELISVSDGLVSNNVQSVYAENDSRIWIGTDQGLCFYDGEKVSIRFINGLSLAEQEIRKILPFQNGLAILRNGGVSIYDGSNFADYNASNGLLTNDIKDIAVDEQNQLWIASEQGVSKFDGSSFTNYPNIKASLIGVDSVNQIFAVYPAFWLPNQTNFKVFRNNQWDTLTTPSDVPTSSPITDLFKTRDGKFIAASEKLFYHEIEPTFNLNKKAIINPYYSLSGYQGLAIEGDRIWFGIDDWGPALFYTEDSLGVDMNSKLTKVNDIYLNDNQIFVATDYGLGIAPKSIKPIKVTAGMQVNNIGTLIIANRGIFQDSNYYGRNRHGLEIPAYSGRKAIYNSNFITVSKVGRRWLNNPEYEQFGIAEGPLNNQALGFDWPMVVHLSQAEIDLHRLNYQMPGYVMPEGIRKWPANGDSTLGVKYKLAPFQDVNNNGCYDPESGDFPLIKGDEATYWIKHSTDPQLKFEYHYLLYGFNSSTDLDINQSLFLDFRIINRSDMNFDSLKSGYFVDFELGNNSDDFVGCDSLNNLFYVYNADSLDEDQGFFDGHGSNVPFVGVKHLSDSMESFVSFDPPNGQGGFMMFPYMYKNLLEGKYLYGHIPKYGGDSSQAQVPTKYMYTGNPYTQVGWTEANNEGDSLLNRPGYRKVISSVPYYSLAAGESKTISVAIGYGRKDSVQTHLENYNEMQRVLSKAQTVWEAIPKQNKDYSTNYNCTIVGLAKKSKGTHNEIRLYPNPTKQVFRLKSNQNISIDNVEIIDLNSRLIKHYSSAQSLYNLDNIPSGIYFIKIELKDGGFVLKKLMVSH